MKNLVSLLDQEGIKHSISEKIVVEGLCYDSRKIKKGDLFFAIPGSQVDGHQYLSQVSTAGAVAAIVEKISDDAIPQIVVPNVLETMALLSNLFFDKPSEKIRVVGMTGTNGKTTTTYLIEDILKKNNKKCGVMGTVNYRMGDELFPAPNTTPQSLDVNMFFSELVRREIFFGVMEVSSHALVQHRVDHIQYEVAVFSNLTQDHLDYHKTMENYYQAKALLFLRPESPCAVINIDDEYGARLFKELGEGLSYGFSSSAMLRAKNEKYTLSGIEFDVVFPSGKTLKISNNLLGKYNIYNCLAAAGALLSLGFSDEEVSEGLNQNHRIPGRLERVEAGQNYVVVVDYAHTPDALEQVLITLKNTGPRKLFCIFGAGGDRDRGKRPKMGAVAVKMADRVFVTSDNPRTENPQKIISDILEGIVPLNKNNHVVVEDRSLAIRQAVKEAGTGDIVLIAGKGHENYQIIGNTKHHFSDFEEAEKAIRG
ncbi:MAG: UDP-N-acetylmuramoyl-L-alanyl-D-glutamate--2,6-diaminopimelate ligase [Elusimicrobiota bacterium]